MSKAKYVLEDCLIFEELGGALVDLLAVDALFLQSVIFMAETYCDLVGGRDYSHPSQDHLKTVQLLRQRLAVRDEKAQVADQTVFVVVNLATHAYMSGDNKAAQFHLQGIRKIVDLRGGLKSLTQTKLLIEILRLVTPRYEAIDILCV